MPCRWFYLFGDRGDASMASQGSIGLPTGSGHRRRDVAVQRNKLILDERKQATSCLRFRKSNPWRCRRRNKTADSGCW